MEQAEYESDSLASSFGRRLTFDITGTVTPHEELVIMVIFVMTSTENSCYLVTHSADVRPSVVNVNSIAIHQFIMVIR
jgi:hypothetical protein